MKNTGYVLRSVAALAACSIVTGFGAAAYAHRSPARSLGVTTISTDRSDRLACAGTYISTQIEGFDGRGIGLPVPGLNDVVVRYDAARAYHQGSRSAGCEAEDLAMAPLLQATPSAAPEPTTWAVMILGLAIIGLLVRRRCQPAAQNVGREP